MISPCSSKSMMLAAGAEPRPGMVVMSPQMGYTKPAPTLARTSRTLTVWPVGAPFREASELMERCVFAMQTGRLPKPFFS